MSMIFLLFKMVFYSCCVFDFFFGNSTDEFKVFCFVRTLLDMLKTKCRQWGTV